MWFLFEPRGFDWFTQKQKTLAEGNSFIAPLWQQESTIESTQNANKT
jgi:hypothetical protein